MSHVYLATRWSEDLRADCVEAVFATREDAERFTAAFQPDDEWTIEEWHVYPEGETPELVEVLYCYLSEYGSMGERVEVWPRRWPDAPVPEFEDHGPNPFACNRMWSGSDHARVRAARAAHIDAEETT